MRPKLRCCFAILHAIGALEHGSQTGTNLMAKLAVTLVFDILSVNLMWLFVGVFGVLGVLGHGCRV